MAKIKIIGKRTTRLSASKLRGSYISERAKKPYKAFIEKCGKKWCVKVQEKKR